MGARAWQDTRGTIYLNWDDVGPYLVVFRDGSTEERWTIPQDALPLAGQAREWRAPTARLDAG